LFSNISEPDVPTLSTLEDIQQESVSLTWNFGNTQTRNRSVVFYLDTTDDSEWQTTDNIDMLTGLTAGHTYVLYLEVTSFDKTAQSANTTVTTRKCLLSRLYIVFSFRLMAKYREKEI